MISKHEKYYNCKNENILLTGSNGFIGKNILNVLEKDTSISTVPIEKFL